MPPRKKRSTAERPSAPADATDPPPPPPAAVKKEEEDDAAAAAAAAATTTPAVLPNVPPQAIVAMGATMFLEVQNDGQGPAVRSEEAEQRALEAAAKQALGALSEDDACPTLRRHPRTQEPVPLCWEHPPPGEDEDVEDDDEDTGRVRNVQGYPCGPVLALSMRERSGCELTLATVLKVRACVLAAASWQARHRVLRDDWTRVVCPVVVVTGTDALEELALALDWLLPRDAFFAKGRDCGYVGADHTAPPVACVVTGAMRPASSLCPDGPANVADALVAAKAAAEAAMATAFSSGVFPSRPGVLVAMGGQLHAARHVRKVCSEGNAGFAFTSGPSAGPVGSVSSSRSVAWAHGGGPPPPCLLPMRPPADASAAPWWLSARGEAEQDADCFDRVLMAVRKRDLRTRVPIWTLTTDAMAPPDSLLDAIDGLVLAGPGAGSVPRRVLETLAPAAKARNLPVVLCSRCGAGPNHDAGLYGERSAARYEEAGLELWRGADGDGGPEFERFSPLQARLALSIALSLERARERWAQGGGRAAWEAWRNKRGIRGIRTAECALSEAICYY